MRKPNEARPQTPEVNKKGHQMSDTSKPNEYVYAYTDELEKLSPRLDLGNSCDLRVFLYPLNTEMPFLTKLIDEKTLAEKEKQLESVLTKIEKVHNLIKKLDSEGYISFCGFEHNKKFVLESLSEAIETLNKGKANV